METEKKSIWHLALAASVGMGIDCWLSALLLYNIGELQHPEPLVTVSMLCLVLWTALFGGLALSFLLIAFEELKYKLLRTKYERVG